MHKIGQSGRFLGSHLGPLLKAELSLIGNVLKPLAKSIFIPLGLTAAALATDAAIHKKIFGLGRSLELASRTKNCIMKILKFLEESGLLIKGISKAIKNDAKKQKKDFSECF